MWHLDHRVSILSALQICDTLARYCDKPCNVPECGYDGGDCGFDNLNREGVLFYFVF
jgi:hypothetical protein